MKLSFSTLGCPYYGIDEIIGMAVKNGYQGIEIRTVSGTTDIMQLYDFKGSGIKETAKKIASAGLEVVCIGTSISFAKACLAHQNKNLEAAKTYMKIAKELDCRFIRTFGGPIPATQGFMESMKWSKEGYGKMCELGEDFGIKPLVETHDDFSTKNRVLELIEGIQNIGVVWDIEHSIRNGEAPEDTYASLKAYIKHVHIKDVSNLLPGPTDFPLIGEGKLPIKECIAILKSSGYSGYLSFEWEKFWHPEIIEPEIAIPHFAKKIRDWEVGAEYQNA